MTDLDQFTKDHHQWVRILDGAGAKALASRWVRAWELYESGSVFFRSVGQWEVTSQTDNTIQYTVYPASHDTVCPCPDYPRAPFGWCKHRLAVWMADQEWLHDRDQAQAQREERTQPIAS